MQKTKQFLFEESKALQESWGKDSRVFRIGNINPKQKEYKILNIQRKSIQIKKKFEKHDAIQN